MLDCVGPGTLTLEEPSGKIDVRRQNGQGVSLYASRGSIAAVTAAVRRSLGASAKSSPSGTDRRRLHKPSRVRRRSSPTTCSARRRRSSGRCIPPECRGRAASRATTPATPESLRCKERCVPRKRLSTFDARPYRAFPPRILSSVRSVAAILSSIQLMGQGFSSMPTAV